MLTRYTMATARDAGLYREFVAERFGAVFAVAGGTAQTYRSALYHARALARLVGKPLPYILEQIAEDYFRSAQQDF